MDQVLTTTKLLSHFSSSVTFKVIKTWINSWSTSRRYHEDLLFPRLFGCDAKEDDLLHYVACPIMWDVVCHHFPNLFLAHPVHRLGLCLSDLSHIPSPEIIFDVLTGTSHGYHAIKQVRKTKTLPLSSILPSWRSLRALFWPSPILGPWSPRSAACS